MTSCLTRTCTVQSRRKGIRFFKNGAVVLPAALTEELREADIARLYVDNKKNGHRGITMYHYAVLQYFYPVKYLAAKMHHIYVIAPEDASSPISYIDNTKHVTTSDITLEFHECLVLSGILSSVYLPLCVSAYSLRASRAMAIRLNDVGEDIIKKFGRWSSAMWLTYIYSQISSLYTGLS